MQNPASKPRHHVVVIENDSLIQEGLRLLLLDLNCKANIVNSFNPWQTQIQALIGHPHLIIATTMSESRASVERLVDKIRAYFREDIPVILLAVDDEVAVLTIRPDNVIVLPGTLDPKGLRKVISALLHGELYGSIC